MPRKTLGVKEQILKILNNHNEPIGVMQLTKLSLNQDNPRIIEYDRRRTLIKYYLKQLVEEKEIKKEKYKNGFVYSKVG